MLRGLNGSSLDPEFPTSKMVGRISQTVFLQLPVRQVRHRRLVCLIRLQELERVSQGASLIRSTLVQLRTDEPLHQSQ